VRRRHRLISLPTLFAAFVLLFAAASGNATGVASRQTPAPEAWRDTVILVSFDGWRWDFGQRASLPNLERFAARGVRARWLVPSFPTKTFPNHYTIVTGLYPGHHGIVANNIFDAPTGRSFSLSTRDEVQSAMWWGGEPIWVAAERAGQKTAPVFWPGSEAPLVDGRRASYWEPFDAKVPGSERVRKVLELLDLPADRRPTFLTLYFEEVDHVGHGGPDRPEMLDALSKSDVWFGELMRGLEERRLTDRVNILVVSDHGMIATSRERSIVLEDYVAPEDARVVDLNPTIGLYPAPGKEEAVYRSLRTAPHLKVYRRKDTPKHWRFRDHPRVPPIVGTMDEGWQILRRRTAESIDAGMIPRNGGQHGYDPRSVSMRGLFMAAGPAFRQGVVVDPFENVSIYNVLARLLRVRPAKNDGDPAVVKRLLR
jgi:predicted AlkP superfamily pyrophosphatase or phosphodiesterase